MTKPKSTVPTAHTDELTAQGYSSLSAIVLPPGTIELKMAGQEVAILRVEESGKVYVRGALVDDDVEVYRAFKSWMAGLCPNCKGKEGDG